MSYFHIIYALKTQDTAADQALPCIQDPNIYNICKNAITVISAEKSWAHSGSQTDSGETNKSHNYCLYLFELFDLK